METRQKEIWATRADNHESRARILDKSADAIDAEMNSIDSIYFVDRGTSKQKDRLRARWSKAHEMREKAKVYRDKAANLRQMSERNEGDAARKRQERLAGHPEIEVGSLVKVWGGWHRVVKVNAKSVRIEGFSDPVAKDMVRGVVSAEDVRAANGESGQ